MMDITHAVSQGWWEQHRTTGAARRTWLSQLYPDGVEIDWGVSNYLFRPPTVEGGKFVHAAPPPLLKWTARARTGALATRFRLAGTKLVSSSQCLCCPAPVEDDAHVVTGCPGTGSADCGNVASKLWLEAGQKRGVPVTALPSEWLQKHLLQVAVGLIPRSVKTLLPSDSAWIAPTVMKGAWWNGSSRYCDAERG